MTEKNQTVNQGHGDRDIAGDYPGCGCRRNRCSSLQSVSASQSCGDFSAKIPYLHNFAMQIRIGEMNTGYDDGHDQDSHQQYHDQHGLG